MGVEPPVIRSVGVQRFVLQTDQFDVVVLTYPEDHIRGKMVLKAL
jgi:hypothetical protein